MVKSKGYVFEIRLGFMAKDASPFLPLATFSYRVGAANRCAVDLVYSSRPGPRLFYYRAGAVFNWPCEQFCLGLGHCEGIEKIGSVR